MHRSSESIGAIAAALAKAQSELANPEKSLVATIAARDPRDAGRTFRYASLASGLEIVRKSLGQHEIATVQTTAIDKEAGLISLTTVLAHASGEWMSSDWPVCPISDASAPQRMGAALTYARRYALFTLVGIAGEDDLDAPDLATVQSTATSPQATGHTPRWANGQATSSATGGHHRKAMPAAKPILTPEASAACRDQLLNEIDGGTSAEDMGVWAHRALPLKNTLRAEDATIVEKAFVAKLDRLAAEDRSQTSAAPDPEQHDLTQVMPPPKGNAAPEKETTSGTGNEVIVPDSPSSIPSSTCGGLAFGKTRRKRDKEHLAFVASKPCLVCGRRPTDAHHLRFAQLRALGRKVSDEFTVPLCRTHHRQLHLRADEPAWWQLHKIDPLEVAHRLWGETHVPANGHLRPAGAP